MTGPFLTPHDNDFQAWPFSHGSSSKAHFLHQSTTLTETLRDNPDAQSVLQPISRGSTPSPQPDLKKIKRNDSCSPKLLLPPLPFDNRRHSDSSVMFSPDSESDDPLSKSLGCQHCLNHAPLTSHPLCTACLSLFLARTRTRKSSSPTLCVCRSRSVSPTGKSRHRGSFNDLSDLFELNKSLENITGHKHVPNPALLRIPSVVIEAAPYRYARSHSDGPEMTKSLSAEQLSKPAMHRRASVCMGDHTFTSPVGWTANVLYCLWLKWALCCCRRKPCSWCF